LTNHTWSFTSLHVGYPVVEGKWIFHIKQNPDGTINRYKAILVAKEFHQ